MALEGILPLTTVSWMALMTFDMGFSVKIKLFPVVIGRYCSGPPWVSLFSQPQTPTRTPMPLVPADPARLVSQLRGMPGTVGGKEGEPSRRFPALPGAARTVGVFPDVVKVCLLNSK